MILRSLIELIRVYETYELNNAKCRVTKYYKLEELKKKSKELTNENSHENVSINCGKCKR